MSREQERVRDSESEREGRGEREREREREIARSGFGVHGLEHEFQCGMHGSCGSGAGIAENRVG